MICTDDDLRLIMLLIELADLPNPEKLDANELLNKIQDFRLNNKCPFELKLL